MKRTNKKAFTLLEILLVVAAIGILAGIVIVAINPGKQLANTRNAQRRADVQTILNATYQYYIDNGILPPNIETNEKMICAQGKSCEGMDLSVIVFNNYIAKFPTDPKVKDNNIIGYKIVKTSGTSPRVTVSAPYAEQGAIISVTR